VREQPAPQAPGPRNNPAPLVPGEQVIEARTAGSAGPSAALDQQVASAYSLEGQHDPRPHRRRGGALFPS
jgi:hypothetical protein